MQNGTSEVVVNEKALRNSPEVAKYFGQAMMIVGALMHEEIIHPVDNKQLTPIGEQFEVAVKVVATILSKMAVEPGDHAPLPFQW